MFRIIGKLAILLVVLGFFMPIVSLPLLGGQNGFELAEYATNISNIIPDADRTREAENVANLAIFLYVSFVSALIGGSMIIPLIMKKRSHIIVFDLVPLVVSGICWFCSYSIIKDYGKLQIGGDFIHIGFITSSIITLINMLIYIKNGN